MKKIIKIWALAALLLSASFFSAGTVLADVKVNNAATANPVVTVGSASTSDATGGNATVINKQYTPIVPGFTQLPSVAGVRSENLTSAETDIFSAGISRQAIAYFEEKGGNLKDFKMACFASAGKTDFVTFDFSGRRVSGSALATGSREIDSRKAIEVMMFIAKEAMDMGGDLVQISAIRRIDIKSHSRGIGTGWNPLCLVGLSGGVSGGTSHEEEGQVVIKFTIWRTSQQTPPPVIEKGGCDISWLRADINDEWNFCGLCLNPCGNNQDHRKKLGDDYVMWYHCTGNILYLQLAISQYWVSLDDFNRGWEPDGKKLGKNELTRNLPSAQKLAMDTRENMFWCLLELGKSSAFYDGGMSSSDTDIRVQKLKRKLAKNKDWQNFSSNVNAQKGKGAAYWFGRQNEMTSGPSVITELHGYIFSKLGGS